MLSTTTANLRCCIIDSERQETGSFILCACASLVAKSMTSQSLRLLHPAAPVSVTAELVNCTISSGCWNAYWRTWAPNIDHIHHSQNSYFNAYSHPGVVQRYIDCTEILLKQAGLCCDVWVFVFSPETSENISSIDDDAETYSLCSPSRPQWQSRQFGFFSVNEKLRVEKNEERIEVFGNPNRLLSHYGHQGDQNN